MKKELKKTFIGNRQMGMYQIANYLIENFNIKTIGEAKREIFLYKNGIYLPGKNTLELEISTILEEKMSTSTINEILTHVKAQTMVDRVEFDQDKKYINLNNGIYNIETRELYQHEPKFLFLNKIRADFNPEAKCPLIDKFLEEILPEGDINIIKEWFAYCLYRDYFIKKAMIFTGVKHTGKTTVLDLFMRLFGNDNMSSVSLQRLAYDKFSLVQLYNKHINVCDDLSADDIKSTGQFKMLTGRSPISAEYKFGNSFIFENYAKLTFACNRIPSVNDNDDDAYFERWIVIKFNQQVEAPDKFLLEKLCVKEEMSGLLNHLLKYLHNILEKQEFAYVKNSEEIKQEMMRSGSPVASFVYDCLEEERGSYVTKSEMHDSFVIYVKALGLPMEEIKRFGKEITKYAKYMTEQNTSHQRRWNNVKLNNKYDESNYTERADEYLQDEPQEGYDVSYTKFEDEYPELAKSIE